MGGRRNCHLLRQKVDQRWACVRTAHARAWRLGSIGLKKSWQLSLASVTAVAAHCWIDTMIDIVTRSLMLVCVVRSHQSSQPFVAAHVVFLLHEKKNITLCLIKVRTNNNQPCDEMLVLIIQIKNGVDLGWDDDIAIGIKDGMELGWDDGITLGTMLGIKDGIKLG